MDLRDQRSHCSRQYFDVSAITADRCQAGRDCACGLVGVGEEDPGNGKVQGELAEFDVMIPRNKGSMLEPSQSIGCEGRNTFGFCAHCIPYPPSSYAFQDLQFTSPRMNWYEVFPHMISL
jgi:hypothetical protein